MAVLAKNKGGNYTPPPADTYPAVCVGVFDLGTQETNFGTKKQILILWEIDCDKDNGEHHTVSRMFTPSLHPKAEFRKLLESWSGAKVSKQQEEDGFDVTKLLSKPCQLQVIHNDSGGKTYANVGTVMKLAKGQQPMDATITPIAYSWDDDGKTLPNAMPEWVKKKIEQSLEWRGELPEEDEEDEPESSEPSLEDEAKGVF